MYAYTVPDGDGPVRRRSIPWHVTAGTCTVGNGDGARIQEEGPAGGSGVLDRRVLLYGAGPEGGVPKNTAQRSRVRFVARLQPVAVAVAGRRPQPATWDGHGRIGMAWPRPCP